MKKIEVPGTLNLFELQIQPLGNPKDFWGRGRDKFI